MLFILGAIFGGSFGALLMAAFKTASDDDDREARG